MHGFLTLGCAEQRSERVLDVVDFAEFSVYPTKKTGFQSACWRLDRPPRSPSTSVPCLGESTSVFSVAVPAVPSNAANSYVMPLTCSTRAPLTSPKCKTVPSAGETCHRASSD